MDLEMIFYTGSDYRGNIHGFDMNPGIIRPEQARELARRAFSDAPNILSAVIKYYRRTARVLLK